MQNGTTVETLKEFFARTAPGVKAEQSLAIFDAIEDSLRPGETIIFGRCNGDWFARVTEIPPAKWPESSRGASPRDALAQLAQILVAR